MRQKKNEKFHGVMTMSKKVLVIDTPENCLECPLGDNMSCAMETCIICKVKRKTLIDKECETIPEWCPLMDLPEKDDVDTSDFDAFNAGYVEGWNTCLGEITI